MLRVIEHGADLFDMAEAFFEVFSFLLFTRRIAPLR